MDKRMLLVSIIVCLFAAQGRATAAAIFTFNQPPGASAGFSFATTVADFTTTVPSTGGATAVLGAPDGGDDPNTPQYVDFGGGDVNVPWSVTLGLGALFGDGAGVDVRIFTTQLNVTEGFDLYAGAFVGGPFTLVGTFVPPVVGDFSRGTVDVDFNGVPLPVGAQYLRFIGTEVPISTFSRGFDFDAVGVRASTDVPEPALLSLLGLGVTVAAGRRRRTARR